MKKGKLLLGFLLGILALMLVLVLVLSLPPVQRWAVIRVLDPGPEGEVSVDEARIGFQNVTLRGLEIKQPHLSWRLDSLDANLSLPELIFRRHANVDALHATGLVVDLSRFIEEPAPDPAPFDGIFPALDLPVNVSLHRLSIEGEMIFSRVHGVPASTSVNLTGGGIAPGREGTVHFAARGKHPGLGDWPQQSESRGEIRIGQNRDGRFQQIHAAATLTIPAAETGQSISARLEAVRNEGGEHYRTQLQPLPDGDDRGQWLLADGTFHYADRELSGTWNIDLRDNDPLPLGNDDPASGLTIDGGGSFSIALKQGDFATEGSLRGQIDEPGRILEVWEGMDGFRLASDFQVARDREWLHLSGFFFSIAPLEEAEEPWLQARATESIRLHPETFAIEVDRERENLIEVNITGLPIEWPAAFLTLVDPAFLIEDGELSGLIVAGVERERFFLESVEALQSTPATVYRDGQTWLENTAVRLSGSTTLDDEQITAEVEDFALIIDDITTVEGHGHFSDATANLSFEADLGKLTGQPWWETTNGFEEGSLRLELDGDLSDTRSIRGSASINNAVLVDDTGPDEDDPGPPQAIEAHLELVATQERERQWVVEMPFRLDRNEAETALTLSGQIIADAPFSFDLRLDGEHLIVRDVLALNAALIPVREEIEAGRHEEPFWQEVTGRLEVAVTSVQAGAGIGFGELAGELLLKENSATADAEATFMGSPLTASGTLDFLPDEERPYHFAGEAEAPRVDIGSLFQTLQPERPPLVDGIFYFNANAYGEGFTPADLGENVRGKAVFHGEAGSFHLFHTESPLAGLGLGIGGILGGLGTELGSVGRIADRLADIQYDRLDIVFTREAELDLRLTELFLLSDDVHLQGEGRIEHEPDVDFVDQHLVLELDLAARGDLKDLLERARVLDDEDDEYGYRPLFTTFTIEGSLADLDLSPFFELLADAALRLALPPRSGNANENDDN